MRVLKSLIVLSLVSVMAACGAANKENQEKPKGTLTDRNIGLNGQKGCWYSPASYIL